MRKMATDSFHRSFIQRRSRWLRLRAHAANIRSDVAQSQQKMTNKDVVPLWQLRKVRREVRVEIRNQQKLEGADNSYREWMLTAEIRLRREPRVDYR